MKKLLSSLMGIALMASYFNTTISVKAGVENEDLYRNVEINIMSEECPNAYYNVTHLTKKDLSEFEFNYKNSSKTYLENCNTRIQDAILKLGSENLINEIENKESSRELVSMSISECYVSESYDDNECIDSHLMTKNEIFNNSKELYKNNLCTDSLLYEICKDCYSSSQSPKLNSYFDTDTQTKYSKLTLVTSVWDMDESKGKRYVLAGHAYWNLGSAYSINKYNTPAVGQDYIALSWGGNFDYDNEGCIVTDDYYKSTSFLGVNKCNESAQAAIGWSFDDMLYLGNSEYTYASTVECAAELSKRSLEGKGNTTSAKCTYIHTYDKMNGSINFSVSTNAKGINTGVGVSLSNVEKQWSLVSSVSGLYY